MNNIVELLLQDIKEMPRKKHFFFWILPSIAFVILISFYFSQVPSLVEFVCPSTNREYGIVENLQLFIIFCIFLMAAYGIFHVDITILKIGFALISIFSLFVFFEEMDYGAHFGQENYFLKLFGVSNVHNIDDNAKWFKRPIYLVIIILFLIAPIFQSRITNRYIQYVTPLPRLMLVVFIALFSDLIPRFIVAFNIAPDGGFDNNIGEFSELGIYYLFLLYVYQLIFEKKLLPKNQS